MKDDKNYSWVKIDWYNDYPSIRIVREKDDKKAEYYGPYPNKFPVSKVLKRLRKLFPYCERMRKRNGKIYFKKKPCFDYHIGLCSGVCADLVSKTEHRKNVTAIRRFFQGKKLKMIEEMKKKMMDYSDKLEFEKASILRDRIRNLEYVTQHIKIGKNIDDVKLKKIKRKYREEALSDLLHRLGIDENIEEFDNYRIECYDISNIQGKKAVGSMVVFIDGKPKKEYYRKFKIRTKDTPDDFGMMGEVFERRLKYLQNYNSKKDESFVEKPDLVIVDGGKGQLSSVYKILKKMKLQKKIPVVGLAKREEEIFKIIPKNSEAESLVPNVVKRGFKKIRLPRRSNALYLVQRIRDEAHRFAIGYHRKIRSDQQVKSVLDDIPGVGKVTKRRLIEAFGSVNGIKKARLEEIASVVRNKKTLEAIKKVLKL